MAQGWLSQQHGAWNLRPGLEDIAQEIPATLRELVTQRQTRLNATEQRLLEVASVSGLEFSAPSVAAGLATEVIETESWCEELTRRKEFLQTCGVDTWADGTVATRYRFRHALYQGVVYKNASQQHAKLGSMSALAHAKRKDMASGAGRLRRDWPCISNVGKTWAKAIRYHHLAAQQAMQRSGYQEAVGHLNRGLELLQQRGQTTPSVRRRSWGCSWPWGRRSRSPKAMAP